MAFSTHTDYRICRACLTAQTSFSYFIFENVSPDIYCFCTSVQVSKDEQLPRGICNSCYELLNKYSEFKQTCLQSQATLLDLQKDYKIKIEIKTDCVQNCELNDSQGDEIKTEILDTAVKVEDEEIGHDYIDEVDHHAEIKLPSPELFGEKHFTRKAKKLVKSKQHKGIKPIVKKKKFIYTCDVCQKKFNFKERFEAHKLEHEGKITTIHCSPCNKTFVTWSGLKRHKESEHTQVSLESLKCPTCGKIFKSRQTLKMHEKVHGNRKLIMCDVCGRGLTSSVILRAHLETHKENRERSFTCNQCGKQFFTKMILQSHVTRRHSGRKFICQVCSCTFTDKYNLSKHLHIHEGNKLYKCEICNNSYATHSTLTEHKRLHSGERPYVCNYCLKAFVSRKRLTDHVRIHTGDKPHKCTLCEQRFTQRGTLKRHMKVHDRPASTLS